MKGCVHIETLQSVNFYSLHNTFSPVFQDFDLDLKITLGKIEACCLSLQQCSPVLIILILHCFPVSIYS